MHGYQRIPRHIGVIPDGNRRWAESHGLAREDGYKYGIDPGFQLYKECVRLGVKELTFYGFTQDNTKRPAAQTRAFRQACVDSVRSLVNYDANLLIIGNTDSALFPDELREYTVRRPFGKGLINVNFLVNYGWDWDLKFSNGHPGKKGSFINSIASCDISRIDLIIRWGGRRRLSGFLPVQSIYADFYVLEEMWPDFKIGHLHKALDWYQQQDVTLGG